MPEFSKMSEIRFATLDPRLQNILREAIKTVDFTILCGHRGEEEQNEAFQRGTSKLKYPHSKHNPLPSQAVDLAPWFPDIKIDWKDSKAFARLAGYIQRIADEQGTKIRWGGDWDGDWRSLDERFIDLPHFELVGGP